MSSEASLNLLCRLGWSLDAHDSPAVRDMAKSLRFITAIILHWHQPTFVNIAQAGYTCFDVAGQETLKNITKRLESLLKVARILLKSETIREKAIGSLSFSSDEIREIKEQITYLRRLVMRERLTAYFPYMLGKIRRCPEWSQSAFAKMTWEEVDAVLADSEHQSSLEEVLDRLSLSCNYEREFIKIWIHGRANMSSKDLYIVRTVQDSKLDKLANRVLSDETHLEHITADDDLEARAYRLAFTTFREEWFVKLDIGFYILTDKADRWLDAQQKAPTRGSLFLRNGKRAS